MSCLVKHALTSTNLIAKYLFSIHTFLTTECLLCFYSMLRRCSYIARYGWFSCIKQRKAPFHLNVERNEAVCIDTLAHSCSEKQKVSLVFLQVMIPFCFTQVFGDYYHFRHNAVEKRAATSHKDVHKKLQEEPRVRLVLAAHRLQHVVLVTKKIAGVSHTVSVLQKKRGLYAFQLKLFL